MHPIDLTLTATPGMRGISMSFANTLKDDGWNAANWTIYSHSGTHADAPLHFEASDQTIDEMPLTAFMGKAWVADIMDTQPRQWLVPEDLSEVANSIQPDDCLLLRTGWSHHLEDSSIYRDGLPRISDELAEWLVEKQVKLVGTEAPSVADVNDLVEVDRIHKILLGAGITIVEGLCNLEKLESQVFFMALPLKLAKGDGAPVRALAFNGKVAFSWT
jgi:arylformamidase